MPAAAQTKKSITQAYSQAKEPKLSRVMEIME
jgi:hypothetical protein